MKNILLAVAAALVAFFAYNYFTNNSGASSGNPASVPEINLPDEQVELISKAPANAAVFFLEPGNGTSVQSPVTIRFGITNMQVAPAGENLENSGHHHLLIDLQELPDMTKPLPATEQIVHFGKGQTETTLELTPGEHSLQLLLGNYLHIPHDQPVISKKITITVE